MGFKMELPTEEIKKFQKLEHDTDNILAEMTKAGAEVVAKNMESGAPDVLKGHIKISKTYETPTDGGINTKVYISGYIPFSDPNRKYFTRAGGSGKSYSTTKGVPADFLANIFEYGRDGLPFPKRPFVRKAFKDGEVAEAMHKVQVTRYKDIWGAQEYIDDWINNNYGKGWG